MLDHSPNIHRTEALPQILLLGRDAHLLDYRNQVLCWAGFSTAVICITGQNAAELSCAQVAVLCHTLSRSERIGLTAQLRRDFPRMRIVALDNSMRQVDELNIYDNVIDSLSGPDGLIRAIRRYLPPLQA